MFFSFYISYYPQVQEMEQTLPGTCAIKFDNPNELFNISLTVSPDEGYWAGGTFHFHIHVTEEYNMAVSLSNLKPACTGKGFS